MSGSGTSPPSDHSRFRRQPAYAHFGLSQAEKVVVEVILPHGKGQLKHKGVRANQVLKVKQ